MIVREGSLVTKNVLIVEEIIEHVEWYKPVLALRNNLVSENIYYRSPVIFTVENYNPLSTVNDRKCPISWLSMSCKVAL